ncbi:hypothetical protein [Granulicatella sp.]
MIAQAGDIFVKSVPGSPYGHTGVIIEDSDGYTLNTIEQNVDGNSDYLEVGGLARYRTRPYTNMVGYIRLYYSAESDTAQISTGWKKDATGWQFINDKWYYCNVNNGDMIS